jgi:hypothetical protein
VSEPAYTRLDVDERRRRLLELGQEISKALLYHLRDATSACIVEGIAEPAQPEPAQPERIRRRAV